MAQTGNTLPYFPNPPREYEQRYLAEVIKAFSLFMRQSQNPGQERATNIVLTSLQQNEYGLEPGTVFVVDGQLRIPVLNKSYVAGVSSSGVAGSVSVSTT